MAWSHDPHIRFRVDTARPDKEGRVRAGRGGGRETSGVIHAEPRLASWRLRADPNDIAGQVAALDCEHGAHRPRGLEAAMGQQPVNAHRDAQTVSV